MRLQTSFHLMYSLYYTVLLGLPLSYVSSLLYGIAGCHTVLPYSIAAQHCWIAGLMYHLCCIVLLSSFHLMYHHCCTLLLAFHSSGRPASVAVRIRCVAG